MALPLILFPSTLTNSVSVMLLHCRTSGTGLSKADPLCNPPYPWMLYSTGNRMYVSVFYYGAIFRNFFISQHHRRHLHSGSVLCLPFFVPEHNAHQHSERSGKIRSLPALQQYQYLHSRCLCSACHTPSWNPGIFLWTSFK